METLADDGCLVTGLPAAARRSLLAAAPAETTLIEAGLRPDCDVHARPLDGSLFAARFCSSRRADDAGVGGDTDGAVRS